MRRENDEEFIERLRAEDEIKNVLRQYCRGVDRRDFELVRSCYHPDAHDSHGAYNGGIDGLIEWMSQRHHGVSQSMHMLGNCIVNWYETHAIVETYCVTYQRLEPSGSGSTSDVGFSVGGSGAQTQVRCRYIDKFDAREGDWRIAARVVVYDSLLLEPPTAEPAFASGMMLSTRNADDPLYTFFN